MANPFETDADRAALIEELGGQVIRAPSGTFCAIFDRPFAEASGTEVRIPVLTCRTDDIDRLEIRKGTVVHIGPAPYTIRRHEPDGTGMSRLILET